MTRTAEPFTALHVDLDKLPHRHKPTDRTYVNDRRAGITKPDEIEIFERDDPRHPLNSKPVVPNRADRRARGQRNLSRLQRNQAKLRPSEMVRHLTRYPLYSIRLRRKEMGPAGLTLPELKRHAAIEEVASTLAASSGWSFDEAFKSVSRALSSVKFVPHVADPTAPTVAELEAATEITGVEGWSVS